LVTGLVTGFVAPLVRAFLPTALAVFRVGVFLLAAALDGFTVFWRRLEEELDEPPLAGFDFIGRLAERVVVFRVIAERAAPVRRSVFSIAMVITSGSVSVSTPTTEVTEATEKSPWFGSVHSGCSVVIGKERQHVSSSNLDSIAISVVLSDAYRKSDARVMASASTLVGRRIPPTDFRPSIDTGGPARHGERGRR
jgi:hypothetical protein